MELLPLRMVIHISMESIRANFILTLAGLHKRTQDLWLETKYCQPMKQSDAVAELLLRLRWDDRIPQAKERLSRILEFLWTNMGILKGVVHSDIPSSLYDF